MLLGDLLRSPEDRDRRLEVVPLLLLRSGEAVLTPADDAVLEPDDELLFAGAGSQRRELESTRSWSPHGRVRALRPAGAGQLGLAEAVPEVTVERR